MLNPSMATCMCIYIYTHTSRSEGVAVSGHLRHVALLSDCYKRATILLGVILITLRYRMRNAQYNTEHTSPCNYTIIPKASANHYDQTASGQKMAHFRTKCSKVSNYFMSTPVSLTLPQADVQSAKVPDNQI